MRLEKTPEKLNEMEEQLDRLRQARDEYHTTRNGFIHYNRPEKIDDITPYIGAEVDEDELLKAGYSLVEYLAEIDRTFEALRDAKSVFSKLDNDMVINGRTTQKWQHEIDSYAAERRQLVKDVFELSEPVDEMNNVNFDLGLEYWSRMEDTIYLMFDDE